MECDPERDRCFHKAIAIGYLHLVEIILEKGKDLNTWSANHLTPLFSAVANRRSELVKLFLEKGADVNLPNRHNLGTPLHCACDKGRFDFVLLLLKHGAEVNKLSSYKSTKFRTSNNTALFVASGRGHCDIVEALIANQADVNLPNNNNDIPLDIACQNGHLDVVRVLLDNGADCNWIGRCEATPLIYACQGGYYDIVKVLLERGANINPIGQSRPLHTPLYHAALRGYTSVVKLLLQQGADIHCPRGKGDTPLHGVCFSGQFDLAELFLDMGAEVNRPSLDGKGPLYIACAAGHSIIVDMLLVRGADVDKDIDTAQDRRAWLTPLYVALRLGHREMISTLLNKEYDNSYPYDNNHLMGKTLCEVRTYFDNIEDLHFDLVPSSIIGKLHSNLTIKEHMLKLRFAGLADNPKFQHTMFFKCMDELNEINSFKIFQNVTLGIVFQRAKGPLYLRNQKLLKKIEDVLSSPLLQGKFPIYAHILRNTLEKSKRIFSQITVASLILERLQCQPKLPIHVLENILKHLEEEDLKNICSFE